MPTVQREVQHDNNSAYERDEIKTVDKNNWTILKDTADTDERDDYYFICLKTGYLKKDCGLFDCSISVPDADATII